MTIIPITFRAACDFITKLHRHHPKPQGCKFALGAVEGGKLVAVATAGRPVARKSDDGLTAEITRVCSDGTRNACSFIYGAMRRVLQAMGYRRIITFTLKSESGESLRGAGFEPTGESSGRSWSVPSRQRETKHQLGTKVRWESNLPDPARHLSALGASSIREITPSTNEGRARSLRAQSSGNPKGGPAALSIAPLAMEGGR